MSDGFLSGCGKRTLYVTEDTESILILLKKNNDDMNQSQIYTQISNAAQAKAGADIKIAEKNLLSTGTFETEEAISGNFRYVWIWKV